ncbi:MAG: peptidoglycan-binding domain-containing protein [Bacteroidota bacterium]
MLFKIGSQGSEVKKIQTLVGVKADGIYGRNTAAAVARWQEENGLSADGLVGTRTWEAMFPASTDGSERSFKTDNGLHIENYFLSKGEYKPGPTEKEFLFIHHTAGWHNPYKVIDGWERDKRGEIATEFVIGGQSVKGNSDEYDGLVLKAFPREGYAWHLGKNGSQYMHTHSVGIEVCNFGWINEGKTYAGTRVVVEQLVHLAVPFRGYDTWHRYSEEQIESLRKLILFVAERDNINVREGLVSEIKAKGHKGFEYNEDAFYGRIKGLWTHTNIRKDKYDMFPQEELLQMLVEL